MNFGKWILVSFVLFTLFIGTLVTICARQDMSLVDPDYYKHELEYQNQIEREKNTLNLEIQPTITVNGEWLQVHIENFNRVERGELKLFRPSNPNDDRVFQLTAMEDNLQQFDMSRLQSGMYKARLSWTIDNQEYYFEETIYI